MILSVPNFSGATAFPQVICVRSTISYLAFNFVQLPHHQEPDLNANLKSGSAKTRYSTSWPSKKEIREDEIFRLLGKVDNRIRISFDKIFGFPISSKERRNFPHHFTTWVFSPLKNEIKSSFTWRTEDPRIRQRSIYSVNWLSRAAQPRFKCAAFSELPDFITSTGYKSSL
jgi:hypothetical protein